MRFVIAISAAAVMLLAGAAHAEKRLFIVANDGDAYGVDRCLTSGAPCGAAVAMSYCKSRQFGQALSYRKVDRDDITGAIPAGDPTSCKGGDCGTYVAIECSR
ncbi:MAG: hypothetical protein WBD53_21240 [Xanthobacteraceae bacterium]